MTGTWNPIPPDQRASCHGTRRAFRGEQCRECYQLAQVHLLGDREWPARIAGRAQAGGERIPETCPHCGAAPPTWMVSEAGARCVACGADFFRTVGTLAATRQANMRRRDERSSAGVGP